KVGEIYPSVEILKIAREYKIPLTVGSDAHSPEDIGRDFDTAYELIQIYGGGKISIFEKRERKEVSLRSY
ncbi:PHP-associated, partial [Candidatus Kryptobacter tengchongensis]